LGPFLAGLGAISGLLGSIFRFVSAVLVSFFLVAIRLSLFARTNLSPLTQGCREWDASMYLPEFVRELWHPTFFGRFSICGFSLFDVSMLHLGPGPADCALRD
jgi:hypothetical protein